MKIDVFFDPTEQTVEVYKANKADRIVRIENVKTANQAKAALKRRGITTDADSEDTYPYGTRWEGTASR